MQSRSRDNSQTQLKNFSTPAIMAQNSQAKRYDFDSKLKLTGSTYTFTQRPKLVFHENSA